MSETVRENAEKLKNWLKRIWFRTLVGAIATSAILIGAYQLLGDRSWDSIKGVWLFWGNTGTLLLAAFGVRQLYYYKKDYNVRNDRADREKAIELAEVYANRILLKSEFVTRGLNALGVSHHTLSLPHESLRDFDEDEMRLLLGQSVDEITRALNPTNPTKIMKVYYEFQQSRILRDDLFIPSLSEAATAIQKAIEQNDKKKRDELGAQLSQQLIGKLLMSMVETLNDLEYFAMYFNNGLADEEVVYQSLHQTYCNFVQAVYFFIASRNYCGKDKYYTNVIDLYQQWSDRYLEKQQAEKSAKTATTHKKGKLKK